MIDIEAFRTDGYLVLRDIIRPATLQPFIDVCQARVDKLAHAMLARGDLAGTHADEPFERRLNSVMRGRDLDNREWDPVLFCAEFRDLVSSPELTDPLSELLGREITYQGNAHLRPYLPRPLGRLPWHQDAQFYGSGTEHLLWQMVQVWLPLTDADITAGCLAVVPGSHHWGLIGGAVPGDDNVRRSTLSRQERIYALAAERARFAEVRLLPVRKGDLVVFTNLLVHTGTENRSDTVRWSVDARFESSVGSRPLSELERQGFEVLHRRLAGRGQVPLRVRGADGPESWADWQRNHTRTQVPA